jgi:hypothetical protein
MKITVKHGLSVVSGLMLLLVLTAGLGNAQPPAPSPKTDAVKSDTKSKTSSKTNGSESDEIGDYNVTASMEVGFRGLGVYGDENKFKSDLNYRQGLRLFDSSFLLQSKEGKGGVFDTFLVTSSGFGGDPNGHMRISVEKPKWYRFDGTYRRLKYFRFLNNFANPNWVFSPASFSRPPDPATGAHGFNTRMQLGDFDLTILPKDERIRFNIGFSRERYNGPAFLTYHAGGNEFLVLSEAKSRANDWRVGADGKAGPIDFSFMQGFRRFRDDSFSNLATGINLNPAAAQLTSFDRQEPTRGSVNYTRLSLHSFVAGKLDLTARIVHSRATSNFTFLESFIGRNWNPRITGWPPTPPAATPNILNLGQYNITGNTKRPNTLGDFGATFLATDKLRISETFRVETFEINGRDIFGDFFSITRGTRTDSIAINNLDANRVTKYRKYQNTVEGDYQFNPNYSVHLGYRYATRRIEESFDGFNLGSNGSVTPPPRTTEELLETNHTHAFFAGFKARPTKKWTIYFDAEHGTADNVFTRIGNYDYTNIRAKTRIAPSRKVTINLALITKDNSNPSEIAGVSLEDFGVDIKSRVFTSSIDWMPSSRLSFSTGYNHHWVNSDAVIDYFFNSVRHPLGHSLYFVRNNFFFVDSVARIAPRVTLYTAYRINKDNGQGDRRADPTGTPGTLMTSYPMSFQCPEGRLSIRLERHLDWNIGYQFYNYHESALISVRPQNYHAHMPYMSLRLYFGRKE